MLQHFEPILNRTVTARLEVKHNLPRPKVRMVNPLASRGLSGLLVVAGAVASAITCPIYVFKDPDVVEEPEATNLVTEIRRFAESVILLHSTSDLVNCLLNGTLNGSQLVVPKDQQLNSLEMALHAQNQSSELLLQHMVHGELHIVFHHSQYFAWTHCSSSGARNLSGGGFGQGPSRLPNVTLVACIPTSSLPTVVDGVYGTSSIFAWTAPQGAGRMTYMGADYFEVLPEWPQLLESSLASRCLEGNATTGTRTTTVTTTTPTTSCPNMVHTGCPVYMLNDPWIVDASQEGTNLLTEIRRFADSVIVLDSTSDLVALLGNSTLAGGQLVVPEQEWGSLSSALGSQSRSLLAQHIEAGLHLVVHSSVELIMQITGWSLWTTSCSAGSSAPQDLRGGGFGQGPGSLPSANLVACVPRSSSPSSMDGAYGTMHMLYAWTAPYGSGRITYMGADYFEVRPEWPELLESSLGARCYSGNTTTVTRTTVVTTTLTTATVTVTPLIVECGSVLYGSNVGQPNTIGSAAGDVWHMFCPTAAGTVEISTCGSDYDTFLYIQGSNIDYSCDDCGSCGSRTETTVTNFLPGECYNIIVGGFSSREGMYVLSISCEALTTTPPPVITTTPPPVITITCPIYFLNDPEIFDEPVEVANLLAAIRRFADPVILLNSTTDLVNSVANGTLGKQLIIPWPFYLYQNWQSRLDYEHRLLFIQKIEEGLHLVVHAALDLINLLSGWQTAWSYGCRFGESASQDLWGGGFGQGPSELPYQIRLGCIEIESLPSSVDGRYSTDEGVYAWTAPYGSGRITYYVSALGFVSHLRTLSHGNSRFSSQLKGPSSFQINRDVPCFYLGQYLS